MIAKTFHTRRPFAGLVKLMIGQLICIRVLGDRAITSPAHVSGAEAPDGNPTPTNLPVCALENAAPSLADGTSVHTNEYKANLINRKVLKF